MQFSDTTNETGLYQDAKDRVGAYTDADFPVKQFTRYANRYLKRATKIAMEASGIWRYNDNNNTESYLESNIVSGTREYVIADTGLQIFRVEMQTIDGQWQRLERYSLQQEDQSLEEINNSQGSPNRYYFLGNKIVVRPTPNYNAVNGLRIYVDFEPSMFVHTDTTKEPGFTSLYHEYCSIGPAYDYASIHGLPQKNDLKLELREIEQYIAEVYAGRVDDGPIIMQSGIRTSLR